MVNRKGPRLPYPATGPAGSGLPSTEVSRCPATLPALQPWRRHSAALKRTQLSYWPRV